ncbi:uncharacterized protein TRAVEDRAFT_22028 [Trametes versicolor FP-101664 SS1]|uniref:uncharacterized protein n=1 Tax=Trametes versicolor (strain FP-101664) TaxID=717944 RepID=UPI0004623011|nr:uncharacterized protein TRAVEDRAFT_22028 [Trametes versicolor FP-101664 SS1]EIW55500.1 hypothetical protein TRAVEDRAFT_22028 [Trametes versicolor FP-101664 SS1]
MFDKVVNYLRKQRSRARGSHQARGLSPEQEAVRPTASGTHLARRRQAIYYDFSIPQSESGEFGDLWHAYAAHELAVASQMQDQFTHEEDFSAGQDVIVDTPPQGRRWNSFSHGISKLPDELLVQVLLYSQQNQNMLLVYLIDTEQWVREFTTRVRTHTPPELSLTGEVVVGDFDNTPISRRGLLLAPATPFFPDSGARLHIHATRTTVMLTDWARTPEGAGHKIYNAHTPNGFSAAILRSPTMFCFPSSSLSILDISVPMHDMDRDTLDAYLEGAPRLQWLHIGCGKDASHALPAYVFDILAACPYDSVDEALYPARWPELTYLGLGGLDWDGGAVMDAALHCLRIREADGARQLEYLAIRVRPRHKEGKPEERGRNGIIRKVCRESDDPYQDATAHKMDEATHSQDEYMPEFTSGEELAPEESTLEEDFAVEFTEADSAPEEGYQTGNNTIADTFALRRKWNSFASISKLPDEVLVEVFLCSWTKNYYAGAYEWDIGLVELTRNMLFDSTTLASLLPEMLPHRGRIRSLELEYDGSDTQISAISVMIQAPFNSLAKLAINFAKPGRRLRGRRHFVILPELYPQLTDLTLVAGHVQWTASFLSQLTALSLNDCSVCSSAMDWDTFLDVLQHGQRLETLVLKGFMGAVCSPDIPSRIRQPFPLAQLDTIFIVDTEQMVRQFLACVRTPTPPELALTGEVDTGHLDGAPISHRGLLLAPQVPFFADNGVRLHIHGGATALMFTDWHRGSVVSRYESSVLPLPYSAALFGSLFVDAFPRTSICMLDLKVPMRDMDLKKLNMYIEGAPDLRWLHIGCGKDASYPLSVAHVFDALTTSALNLYEASAVPCRNLTYLGLGGLDWDGGAAMEMVIDCLRIREARGAQQLEQLAIRVRPRPPNEGEMDGGWEEVDLSYAEELEDMVSCEVSFAVGPDPHGVY